MKPARIALLLQLCLVACVAAAQSPEQEMEAKAREIFPLLFSKCGEDYYSKRTFKYRSGIAWVIGHYKGVTPVVKKQQSLTRKDKADGVEWRGNIRFDASAAREYLHGMQFAQRTVIETLPGTGGQLLKLKFAPIVTLTSIAFDGDTVDSDTYTLIEPDAGMVYREAGWFYTGHAYDYAATYTHGYNLPDMAGADTLPHDIQQAALELCKGIWLARQRDPSVSMESVPDVYTVQYGGQGRNGAPIGAIPPKVQELLLPYKEFKL
jgi:hypothetical protein